MKAGCLIALVVLAGCASPVVSGTDAACDALRPYLPSVSTADTRQTKEEMFKFDAVFAAVCEGD